jgi:hypothetical protein
MQDAVVRRLLKEVLCRFVCSVNGQSADLPTAQEDGRYVLRDVELNPEMLLPPSSFRCERAFARELSVHLPVSAVLASLTYSSSEPFNVAVKGVEVVLRPRGTGEAPAGQPSRSCGDEPRSPRSAKLGTRLGSMNLSLTNACFTLHGKDGYLRLQCTFATAVNVPEALNPAEGDDWLCKKLHLESVTITSKSSGGPSLAILKAPKCSLIARLPLLHSGDVPLPFSLKLDLGQCAAEMDSTHLAILAAFAAPRAPQASPAPAPPSVVHEIAADPLSYFKRIVGVKRPRDDEESKK